MNKTKLLFLLCLLYVVGCKRDQPHPPDVPSMQLVAVAQEWYNKQMTTNRQTDKSFRIPTRGVPVWDEYETVQSTSGNYLIFVKTKGRSISNSDLGAISSLVFSYREGKINSAYMAESIGDADFMKNNSLQFVQKYLENSIPSFKRGAFIISDMKYRVQTTYTVVNGVISNDDKTTIKQVGNMADIKEAMVSGKKVPLLISDQQKNKLRTASSGGCDNIYWVVWEISTGKIISVTWIGTECEDDQNNEEAEPVDLPEGDGSTTNGESTTDMPNQQPLNVTDPCAEKALVSKRAQNSTVLSQNREILTKSTSAEYGTNQNLTSLTGDTYKNTPVTTNNTTNTYNPVFNWNSIDGYTVGWSHGHPGNSAPSPDDIFTMMYHLSDPELVAAGSSAIKFYRDNVSVTTITKDGNYVVTVKDWGKFQTAFDRFRDDPFGFDDDYVNIASQYLDTHPVLTGVGGAYAIMKLFGDAINIFYTPPNYGTYDPMKIDSYDTVINNPCK